MADINANTDAMRQAIREYEASLQEIRDIKNAVQDKLTKLKEESWISEGSDKFFANYSQDWVKRVTQFEGMVETMEKMLEKAIQTYQDMEHQAKRLGF